MNARFLLSLRLCTQIAARAGAPRNTRTRHRAAANINARALRVPRSTRLNNARWRADALQQRSIARAASRRRVKSSGRTAAAASQTGTRHRHRLPFAARSSSLRDEQRRRVPVRGVTLLSDNHGACAGCARLGVSIAGLSCCTRARAHILHNARHGSASSLAQHGSARRAVNAALSTHMV